jgi:hypothetical protein
MTDYLKIELTFTIPVSLFDSMLELDWLEIFKIATAKIVRYSGDTGKVITRDGDAKRGEYYQLVIDSDLNDAVYARIVDHMPALGRSVHSFTLDVLIPVPLAKAFFFSGIEVADGGIDERIIEALILSNLPEDDSKKVEVSVIQISNETFGDLRARLSRVEVADE